MRIALATALALAVSACGLKFDVSRITGLNASFDLARDPEEVVLPECRLVVPPYAPEAEPETFRSTRTFPFRGVEQSISILLDMRLVEASRAIGVERCTLSRFDADDFYEAVVFDPAEEPFFEALLEDLRGIRDRLELDGSGYADLLVAFVQSLDYVPGDGLPKHPIAAFADGVGDCDERSALLAGLLSREGYDVCLFLFAEQQHMAVGLRADGIGYQGTGYAYVEATQPSYVGRGPLGDLAPAPDLLPMGDGEVAYRASPSQRYLAEVGRFTERELERLVETDGPVERMIALIAMQIVLLSEGDLDAAHAAVSALVPPGLEARIREETGQTESGAR